MRTDQSQRWLPMCYERKSLAACPHHRGLGTFSDLVEAVLWIFMNRMDKVLRHIISTNTKDVNIELRGNDGR